MLFKKEAPLYSFELVREAGEDVMYINYLGAGFVPDLADSAEVMARTIDSLSENPNITRIVFVQQRNYSYSFNQVAMLQEISQVYNFLVKQEKILSPSRLVINFQQALSRRNESMIYFLTLLKQDPFAAYFEIKRMLREERAMLEGLPPEYKMDELNYIRLIEKITALLENTSLIRDAKPFFDRYQVGSRELYLQFFRADSVPNFTFTRLMSRFPDDAELMEEYEIGEGYEKSLVSILKIKKESKYFYHITPPEYSLDEDSHMLLNLARNVLIEHKPKAEDFLDVDRTRQVFLNVSKDLLQELAENKQINLSYSELNKLAMILVRHTIGFGLIEVLLQDPRLQDIVLNAPIVLNNIFVRHEKYDECRTNIIPSQEDADSWAAKFRMLSGRPLDEANPILDTDLTLGKMKARVAIIQQPLSPRGLAYALRRHREDPWTLPLFIKKKMMNSLSAGLLSFLVDGARTMLIAGTRSSGKTSLLGSLMLEIVPKFRIIVVEDTLELPADALRKLGYDILRMKVRSAMLQSTTEVAAEEGIRTSLRFGDSCLIIGEVRSEEAKALYEAMRVGALANVVAGTIHGSSPYSVFDRVVNDLGVPVTSFKATDAVLVANPVKSPSGLQSYRRVIQLSEVRKQWTKDPLEEKGFVDLLKYNVEKDELEPTQELINGDSEIIKAIAANVKGWAGNWDAVYDNILLRGKVKQEIVNVSDKLELPELMESKFNYMANSVFYEISEKVRKEIGLPLGERVFPEWQKWLNEEAMKMREKVKI